MTETVSENLLADPYSKQEINLEIDKQMSKGDILYWSNMTDEMVWSASMQSDSMISIGYTMDNIDMEKNIHLIDLSEEQWQEKQEELKDLILKFNPGTYMEVHPVLPQIQFINSSLALVKDLREREDIRFVEPLGYSTEEADLRSGSGCDGSPDYSISSADYSTIAPNTKQNWNYSNANVPAAWNTAQGDGVTVCILDTGGSYNQDNIGSAFTQGNSGGRFVQKVSTKYSGSWWWKSKDSPNDDCGHGTAMAGMAVAPRGTDGNAVGIAYKSDLLTIRGTGDVLVNSSNEKKGVRDGLTLAGQRSDVKVISMSIGDIFYSGTVADGVYYAYNRGKLMMSAAGTSFTWTNWVGVIFPATMSQTIGVTGVKDSNSLQRCSTCHSGSKVDFVLTMEKSSGGSTPITLALSSNQPKYTGGSSCATSMMSGIAALVWSTNPSMSRDQVLTRLKNASQYYPSRSSQYGWGRVDAAAAVNGN
ncbi:hypothetical protein GCM10007940_08270 [Portibacter lacus]|uniref:Peptidase S8/S53 domain-containing protein n=2 Tax=Portibacter lacus TaxID=1099794 RepID=A0AA37WDQ1_9BACT|nr:hypothetical protein GCM10007940_08270 [Portibacter lacus]